jgi:hypothetical protein
MQLGFITILGDPDSRRAAAAVAAASQAGVSSADCPGRADSVIRAAIVFSLR